MQFASVPGKTGKHIVKAEIDMQGELEVVDCCTSAGYPTPAPGFAWAPWPSVGITGEVCSFHAPSIVRSNPRTADAFLRQMLFQEWPRHLGEPRRIILQDHVASVRNTGALAMFQGLNHAVGAFDRYKVGVAGADDEG